MTLATGTKLGRYEIHSKIGEGGMGEVYLKTIDLDPDYYGGHAVLGHAYLKLRLYREALEELNRSFELSGNDSQMLGWLGYGHAVAGQRSKAFSVVKELEEKYRRQEAGGTEIAEVYIGLGDHDQAFAWLDKDVQARRRRSLREIRTCWWIFGAVKSDPRYTSLLKHMGLSQLFEAS
ncbi:MAG TPA: hypothetical protein VI750_01480 [Pyrinomonadaceae bacterium]|nr:hypothetical protein [Pyrinomonadaceae bacterium]